MSPGGQFLMSLDTRSKLERPPNAGGQGDPSSGLDSRGSLHRLALRARAGIPAMLVHSRHMGSIAAISSLKWQIGDELPARGRRKKRTPAAIAGAGGLRTPGLAAGRRILGRGDGFP